MDYQNYVQLLSRYPQLGRKVFFLGAYAEYESQGIEIRDPYSLDRAATSACYQLIHACIGKVIRYHVKPGYAVAKNEHFGRIILFRFRRVAVPEEDRHA